MCVGVANGCHVVLLEIVIAAPVAAFAPSSSPGLAPPLFPASAPGPTALCCNDPWRLSFDFYLCMWSGRGTRIGIGNLRGRERRGLLLHSLFAWWPQVLCYLRN